MSGNSRHIPERMCIVCRAHRPRTELFRLMKPEGENRLIPDPAPDVARHAPGKGFYLCRNSECIEKIHTNKKVRKLFADKITTDICAELISRLSEESVPDNV